MTNCNHEIEDVTADEFLGDFDVGIMLAGECSCGQRMIIEAEAQSVEVDGKGRVFPYER